MSLQRHHDWAERLARMLDSARELSFEWGNFDCAMHVSNCIRCMVTSEIDVAEEYRGKYSDEDGAIAIFKHDLGEFAATMAAVHGMEEVPVNFARRGDVVYVDNGTEQFPSPYGCLGIVALDPRFAACVSAKGLVNVHMHRWKRAWRVG